MEKALPLQLQNPGFQIVVSTFDKPPRSHTKKLHGSEILEEKSKERWKEASRWQEDYLGHPKTECEDAVERMEEGQHEN